MPSRTITNSASELLAQNGLRRSFVVQNEDASIDVFLKQERGTTLSASTTDHDIRLAAGTGIAFDVQSDGKSSVQDRWTIVAASGTPRVSFYEGEEIRR